MNRCYAARVIVARCLLAGVGAVALLVVAPTRVLAAPVEPPPFDLGGALAEAMAAFGQTMLEGFQHVIITFGPDAAMRGLFLFVGTLAHWLLENVGGVDRIAGLLTQTPAEIYTDPVIQGLITATKAIAFGGMGAALAWCGVEYITGGVFPWDDDATGLVRRVLSTAVLVGGIDRLAVLLIQLNNGLAHAVSAEMTLPGWNVAHSWQVPPAGPEAQGTEALGVAVLLYAFAALLTFGMSVVRLALLVLLQVAAPLAMLCILAPGSQWLARLWVTFFVPAVFVQVLQALALHAGAIILGSGIARWHDGEVGGLLSLVIGFATLWLIMSLPSMLRASLAGNRGGVTGRNAQRALQSVLLVRQEIRAAQAAKGLASGASGGVGVRSYQGQRALPAPAMAAPARRTVRMRTSPTRQASTDTSTTTTTTALVPTAPATPSTTSTTSTTTRGVPRRALLLRR